MRKIPISENMTPIDRKCVEAGISRKQLAQMSGIPYVTIDQWGRRVRIPRDVYQLYKVAQVMGCHIEDLIEPEVAEKASTAKATADGAAEGGLAPAT